MATPNKCDMIDGFYGTSTHVGHFMPLRHENVTDYTRDD